MIQSIKRLSDRQLDPTLKPLLLKLTGHRVWSWLAPQYDPVEVPPAGSGTSDEEKADALEKADVISSLIAESIEGNLFEPDKIRHQALIDVDVPAWLVPSSTPGHSHLYIEVPGGIEHEAYMDLLDALARCGIVEEGYAGASRRRGYSSLRAPWVLKGRPILRCVRCKKRPDEIAEYVEGAREHGSEEFPFTADEFAWSQEGTLDWVTGQFACTACYIALGQPAGKASSYHVSADQHTGHPPFQKPFKAPGADGVDNDIYEF